MRTIALAAVITATIVTPAPAQEVQVREAIQVAPQVTLPANLPPDVANMLGARQPFKTGTSRLRGRVLQADGARPLRRAQVRLMSPESGPKTALTDEQGRFEFRELPAGRYTMSAQKSGYMTAQYGQTRPFEAGKAIVLADNQALDSMDIGLPRGGAISGRIVDEFGEPLGEATVTAMRLSWSSGKRRLSGPVGRSYPTDDQGHYRIYGLPPGEYYVSSALRNPGGEGADFALLAGVSATAQPGTTIRSGYANTYFPGTPNPAEGQRVSIAAGQEASNVDFPLVAVRLSRVYGMVVSSDGKPVERAQVHAVPTAAGDQSFTFGQTVTTSAKDGSFVLNNVAPGEYSLRAMTVQVFTSMQDGGNMTVMRTMVGGAASVESEVGSIPLNVSGEDITNVMIVTSKGGTATGRVTFEGGARPSLSAVRVMAVQVETDNPIGSPGLGGGTLKEDGTFELKGLAGARVIRVSAPTGWTMKSVKLNGVDIADIITEFKAGEAYTLEIELTQRVTSITGGVTASDSAAVKDYTTVVFSENPEHWRLPRTRWIAGTRPEQDGRFKIANLPPGVYYAIAVPYLEAGEWFDPELLERLKSHATRITLDEGGTPTLDLKLTSKY